MGNAEYMGIPSWTFELQFTHKKTMMTRRTAVLVLCVAVCALLALPATALPRPVRQQHHGQYCVAPDGHVMKANSGAPHRLHDGRVCMCPDYGYAHGGRPTANCG